MSDADLTNLRRLAEAPSNDPDFETGSLVFRNALVDARVNAERALAHRLVARMLDHDAPDDFHTFGINLDGVDEATKGAGGMSSNGNNEISRSISTTQASSSSGGREKVGREGDAGATGATGARGPRGFRPPGAGSPATPRRGARVRRVGARRRLDVRDHAARQRPHDRAGHDRDLGRAAAPVAHQRRGQRHEEIAAPGHRQHRAEQHKADDQIGHHPHRDAGDRFGAHRVHPHGFGQPELRAP